MVDSSEQLAQRRQGEKWQEQDFAQEIERVLEQMDKKIEHPKLEQDINLMPYHQGVDPSASLDLEAKKVLSNQGDIEILGDDPKEETHNISFDESQHRVFQSRSVYSRCPHISCIV